MSLLNKIIDQIEAKTWCFNYGGTCSTCGMIDVKTYLSKYQFEEIMQNFKDYDYSNISINRVYASGLQKIYSLLTGYTIFNNEFDFSEFEQDLINRYPNNHFVKSLINCNSVTYWVQRRIDRNLAEEIRTKQVVENRLRKEKLKAMAQNDHQLRKTEYRDDLIRKLFQMNIYDKIEYFANNYKHLMKFYPSILAMEAINSFKDFDKIYLETIYQKLCDLKFRQGPWKKFKKELRWFLGRQGRYESY